MSTLLFILLLTLSCATVSEDTNLKFRTEKAIQFRVAHYFLKSGPLSKKPKISIFIHGAGSSSSELMQVFNPSNNQIFVFVDSPYFDESSLERGHKGYLAWPRKKGVTENYNLIQESIDLQSEYLSKISKQIQTQYNANSKINIIGFSQGGVQAYSFASDFGDTLEKLILWATPIKNLTFGKVVEKNVKVTILHNLDDDNVSIDNSTWLHEKLQLLSIASALFKGKGLHKLTNLQISQILGELQE